MKVQGIVALAVVAVAIAACGGGGGGGSTPSGSVAVLPTAGANATATPTSAALPAGYVVDKVSITMAKGSYSTTSVRRAQTVGAGTESIVFTLLQQNGQTVTGTAQTFGLVQTSPGCTLNANQALTCILPVDAPIGQDIFLAQTYDNVNGTGNLTGSGAVALSVGQNTTNTASITLSAQVANVFVVAGAGQLGTTPQSVARGRGAQSNRRPTVVQNGGSSMPLFVITTDSSGNTILNPSSYNAPVWLQLAFDPINGANGSDTFNTTADITLTATYVSGDPSPCNTGTASISTPYASLPLCSPSDTVSAAFSASGGSNPSTTAYVFGTITNPGPAPSSTPDPTVTPSTNSFAYFYVFYPTPAPSPSGGSISVGVQ